MKKIVGTTSIISAMFLIAINISLLGRDSTVASDGSDENRSDLRVINQQQLRVVVDVINCRWSAHLKGTKVSINNAYFLPGNDPSGWKVISSINSDDKNDLGNFVTVTLKGTKSGELDFNYQISVSKSGNDIIISLGRSNNTGHSIDITDMDYFVSDNVLLEGTNDQWITFGAHSIFHDYYDLIPVNTLKEPGMYESSHVIRNQKTGNVILMGHLTVNKGHSRFEVQNQGKVDMMRVRAYCNYKIIMPNSKSFAGEKLLCHMSNDGIQGLEHLGDLINIASDVHLKERYPLDFEDKDLIRGTHNTWTSWASGNSTDTKNPRGDPAKAEEFIKKYGLDKFYYGVGRGGSDPDFSNGIQWALYYCGGNGEYEESTFHLSAISRSKLSGEMERWSIFPIQLQSSLSGIGF